MSFRFRITLMTITLIGVLFSVGGTVMIHTTFQSSLHKEEQFIVDNSRMILKMLQMVEKDKEWFDEKDLLETMENIGSQDAIDGVLLHSQEEDVYKRGTMTAFFNRNQDLKDGNIYISYFQDGQEQMFLQATSTFIIGEKSYSLNLGRSLEHIYQVRLEQSSAFYQTFFLLLILGGFSSWLMASYLTKPLRTLRNASRQIACGNLSFRSGIGTEDEIGHLAKDFDDMAGKLEENIRELQEAAEQKDRFMGAFTHELKTPMTSIIGYADLMRTQKLTKEEEEDALNYIFSEAKRLENMSLKMLDIFIAGKSDIDRTEENPKELILFVTEHIKPVFLKENIHINVEGETRTFHMDADLIKTLLINLLDNARKAMKQGGRIDIFVEIGKEDCRISIKDEGQGIPKEELRHITEAFYRVDKSRARQEGSAGLGLALCDKIVKLHGGTMHFESEVGEGTTVIVTLKGGSANEKENKNH